MVIFIWFYIFSCKDLTAVSSICDSRVDIYILCSLLCRDYRRWLPGLDLYSFSRGGWFQLLSVRFFPPCHLYFGMLRFLWLFFVNDWIVWYIYWNCILNTVKTCFVFYFSCEQLHPSGPSSTDTADKSSQHHGIKL